MDGFRQNKLTNRMAVKIRLSRRGRKKKPLYDVVVADARAPRDGRFIEKIGTYNPNVDPAVININDDRAFDWVMKGAQPTDTVRAMLSYRGVLLKKHLQVGVIKGALTQEEADKRFEEWKETKDAQVTGKVDKLSKEKADQEKARLDAEKKVSQARAEKIAARKKEEEAALVAEIKGEEADEEEAEEATEEAPVAEAPAAEAPAAEAPAAEEKGADEEKAAE